MIHLIQFHKRRRCITYGKDIARILKPNGRVICCGWNTNGLGKNRNFEMTSILIVSHGGSKNDILVTLEYKK